MTAPGELIRPAATPVRFLLPRWTPALASGFLLVMWAAAIWVSAHAHVDPAVRRIALFVHLISLVVGFGAVFVPGPSTSAQRRTTPLCPGTCSPAPPSSYWSPRLGGGARR
ncbi:hypothetical protein V6U89_12295 [Micromonospora sp. CPCC 206171]|uniref:hypothetical protein n=1 Tax=Micromonospora sp. CPCC 206171 TaxID=3122405 RepID=UPI002FEEF151